MRSLPFLTTLWLLMVPAVFAGEQIHIMGHAVPLPTSLAGSLSTHIAEAECMDAELPRILSGISARTVRVETQEGHGSGTIVSSDGLILTALHVVGKSRSLVVVLETGQRLGAEVVVSDSVIDMALLQIEATGLPSATCSASAADSWVLASGFPLGGFKDGLPTVSLGQLHHSKGRILADNDRAFSGLQLMDAPITNGSSGGGLFDRKGRLIGVILARADEGTCGFAVPLSVVTRRRAFGLRLCLSDDDEMPSPSWETDGSVLGRDAWFRQHEARLMPAVQEGRVVLNRPDGKGRISGILVSPDGDILVPASEIRGLRLGAALGRGVLLSAVDSDNGLALCESSIAGVHEAHGIVPVDLRQGRVALPKRGRLLFAASGRFVVGGMLNARRRTPAFSSRSQVKGLLGTDLLLNADAIGGAVVDLQGQFVGMILQAGSGNERESSVGQAFGSFLIGASRLHAAYRGLQKLPSSLSR